MNTEAPKHSPFLAGMRAEGKANHTTPEARAEYEAGFMAVRDMIDGINEIDTFIHRQGDYGKAHLARLVAEVDATWTRVKAAIAGEVAT